MGQPLKIELRTSKPRHCDWSTVGQLTDCLERRYFYVNMHQVYVIWKLAVIRLSRQHQSAFGGVLAKIALALRDSLIDEVKRI